MTTENGYVRKTSVTEEHFIGFRRKPTNLAETLTKKGCSDFKYRSMAGREPGSRYQASTLHGKIYTLYQVGDQMNPHYMPGRDDGDIAALLKVNITTRIISGSSDQPLIDARDSLVEHIVDRYRTSAGAFVYVANP
ncbi:MAG: hypothetical protein AABX82_00290, partial [Nanoarchaeota archaeon]